MQKWYPLHFQPVYQSYLWGGRTLPAIYHRADAPASGPVAESWELSDRADGMSVVANGERKGQSLSGLMREHRREIVGTARAGAAFPLLIKVLDARETLSIQVHPDDAAAARGIGEAKSEAWYALAASHDACVYRGFRPGIDAQTAKSSLTRGTVVDALVRQPVSKGDFIYVPGGTVHAIGGGCLFLEVQQNSNTTYRLFDFNRAGPDGKPRALHIEEGMRVIDWSPAPRALRAAGDGTYTTPYFSLRALAVEHDPVPLADPAGGFTAVFIESGSVIFDYGAGQVHGSAGTSWLIPAALTHCLLSCRDGETGSVVLIRGVAA